jgi:hypothetical protein
MFSNSWPTSRRSSVRSSTSPASVFTSPAGTCTACLRTAVATESKVSPYSLSRAPGTSMLISVGRVPDSSTCVTRPSVRIWSLSCSASSLSAFSSRSPYSATETTFLRLDIRLMTGRSASSGNDEIRSTAVFTSDSAFSALVPRSSST